MFGKKKVREEPLAAEYAEEDGTIVITLRGRLDSVTSGDFQATAVSRCRNKPAVIDMTDVEYLSSAGLRAILSIDKATGNGNKLVIKNASGAVKEVLDMSGFSDFL